MNKSNKTCKFKTRCRPLPLQLLSEEHVQTDEFLTLSDLIRLSKNRPRNSKQDIFSKPRGVRLIAQWNRAII